MPVPKRKPEASKRRPPSREIERQAERIRATNVPLATQWYVLAGELAKRLGVSAGDVLEMFAEMAHVYAYDEPRESAERRAWRDTEQFFVERRRAA